MTENEKTLKRQKKQQQCYKNKNNNELSVPSPLPKYLAPANPPTPAVR